MSEIIDFCAMSYPLCFTEKQLVLVTVLTKRIEGTHKAYAAIVPDVSTTDPNYLSVKPWVKANGNALRYAEANALWPMKPEEYAP